MANSFQKKLSGLVTSSTDGFLRLLSLFLVAFRKGLEEKLPLQKYVSS